jgi:hypothetical protein
MVLGRVQEQALQARLQGSRALAFPSGNSRCPLAAVLNSAVLWQQALERPGPRHQVYFPLGLGAQAHYPVRRGVCVSCWFTPAEGEDTPLHSRGTLSEQSRAVTRPPRRVQPACGTVKWRRTGAHGRASTPGGGRYGRGYPAETPTNTRKHPVLGIGGEPQSGERGKTRKGEGEKTKGASRKGSARNPNNQTNLL